MTALAERAVRELSRLPDADQDAIAAVLLDEIEDEARWKDLFARSQDVLARMADEALAENRAGMTQLLGIRD